MNETREVEQNSVVLRLRKAVLDADMKSHTILTDDVFSYVDFYFKAHKKIIKDANGKKVEQNHHFYWEQSRNFFKAAKVLPIESAPLPMYYCMLNAVKAYLLYGSKNYDEVKNAFRCHGLQEAGGTSELARKDLDNIFVKRKNQGVFCEFAKKIDSSFDLLWPINKGKTSLKELINQVPFVHAAYVSTYSVRRKDEKFLPIKSNESPTFRYDKGNEIRLFVNLDRNYFKKDAVSIPDEVKRNIPDQLIVSEDDGFQLKSKEGFRKSDIPNICNKYRKLFSYISANQRLWYLKKNKMSENEIGNINSMILEIAIVHRFSEIVRYKPEQMIKLMNGKENWLIHEFLSLVLNQFMDEIACEITKQEIMPTRTK